MAFKIGQRVKIIRADYPAALGLLGTISGPAFNNGRFGLCQPVDWADGDKRCGTVANMAPVDDDGDFQRFMERVMKPVDLGQPVTA